MIGPAAGERARDAAELGPEDQRRLKHFVVAIRSLVSFERDGSREARLETRRLLKRTRTALRGMSVEALELALQWLKDGRS